MNFTPSSSSISRTICSIIAFSVSFICPTNELDNVKHNNKTHAKQCEAANYQPNAKYTHKSLNSYERTSHLPFKINIYRWTFNVCCLKLLSDAFYPNARQKWNDECVRFQLETVIFGVHRHWRCQHFCSTTTYFNRITEYALLNIVYCRSLFSGRNRNKSCHAVASIPAQAVASIPCISSVQYVCLFEVVSFNDKRECTESWLYAIQ